MATAVDSSVETYTIVAEPLTPEAFAPFGTVLTRRDQERLPINLYGGKVDVYRPAAIEADQPLEWPAAGMAAHVQPRARLPRPVPRAALRCRPGVRRGT